MVRVSLYFFEGNVLITKTDTSWEEASEIILEHIFDRMLESKYEEDQATLSVIDKNQLFLSLRDKALCFKRCEDPAIVCDVLTSILESLEICKFDRRVSIGDNFLLRGLIDNKKFLIEVSEEVLDDRVEFEGREA